MKNTYESSNIEQTQDKIIFKIKDMQQTKNIADIANSLSSWGYPKCAKRINFLQNCDDFEEGEKPLSFESAKSFLSFMYDINSLNGFHKLGEPLLGLSSMGYLGATWKISENKHLWIQFHQNQIVSFTMIGPNPNSPEDGKFRLNGRNTREEVIKTLCKQGVTKWTD